MKEPCGVMQLEGGAVDGLTPWAPIATAGIRSCPPAVSTRGIAIFDFVRASFGAGDDAGADLCLAAGVEHRQKPDENHYWDLFAA